MEHDVAGRGEHRRTEEEARGDDRGVAVEAGEAAQIRCRQDAGPVAAVVGERKDDDDARRGHGRDSEAGAPAVPRPGRGGDDHGPEAAPDGDAHLFDVHRQVPASLGRHDEHGPVRRRHRRRVRRADEEERTEQQRERRGERDAGHPDAERGQTREHHRPLTVAVDRRSRHEQHGGVAGHPGRERDADERTRDAERLPDGGGRGEDGVETEARRHLPAAHDAHASPGHGRGWGEGEQVRSGFGPACPRRSVSVRETALTPVVPADPRWGVPPRPR